MRTIDLDELTSFGADAGRGCMLALQPALLATDYASAERLRARLALLFDAARERGWLGPRTVAVLPEYVGAWLMVCGSPAAAAAASVADAGLRLIAAAPARFAAALLRAHGRDRLRDALFRMRAAEVAHGYTHLFGGLARDYGVTLVAGSTILPAPRVVAGRVVAGHGPLQNVAAVFRPDGLAEPQLARKLRPTAAERPWLAPATEPPPVFDTPAGRLGVLVCADSWYPEPYAALCSAGAELLAVPSYVEADGAWERPWAGYSGAPPPADVDPSDVGRLTEGQAWLRYAMAGRAQAAGLRCAVNVFLRGRLWDLGSDGQTIVVRDQCVHTGRRDGGDAVACVWLP